MEFSKKQITILLVAEELFAKKGFKSTSVRAIAKVAKINIAMISYYFGSKEKLLKALMQYRLEDYRLELESVIASDLGYMEKAEKLVEMTIYRVHRNRRTHKIISTEFSKKSVGIDFAQFLQQKKKNYEAIENFVQEGQLAGAYNKAVNPKLIAPTLLGTYLHFYLNKRFFEEVFNFQGEKGLDDYVSYTLIPHIQITIKGLLKNEA